MVGIDLFALHIHEPELGGEGLRGQFQVVIDILSIQQQDLLVLRNILEDLHQGGRFVRGNLEGLWLNKGQLALSEFG